MTTIPSSSSPRLTILPLENGDRLTRPEFERRYNAMPHVKKAELIEGEYCQLEPNADCIFCSLVFPGLWLAKAALLDGNLATVLNALQQGLATAEHRTFVERLELRL